MNVIGIDPGLSGAVARITDLLNDGQLSVRLDDAPTRWIAKGKGKRRVYDLAMMDFILATILVPGIVAVIEDVGPMPGQGVTSMFSMGYGVGAWEALLVAHQVPYEKVRPQRWKGVLLDGTNKDKGAARMKAEALFPQADLGSRKDQGRAEALLIAEWRRRQG